MKAYEISKWMRADGNLPTLLFIQQRQK